MAALKPKARIDPQPDTAKKTREDAVDEQIAQNKTMSVKVVGPIGHDATLVNNQVSLTFKIEGQGPWPRPLDILVNGKIGVEKKLNGNDYAANEPIQVSGPGMLEVVIKLPERVQRNWGHFELCFVVNGRLINECSTLTWKGDKIPPPKPRLWAVLVGFSDYSQGRRGTLKYAQNDALDLARLLASDYKASSADPGSGDFSDLHIDLIVAPTSQDARNEVEQLKALPFVTVREPSVASVIAAIEAIAKHDEKEGLVDDLVLVGSQLLLLLTDSRRKLSDLFFRSHQLLLRLQKQRFQLFHIRW